MKSSIYLYGDNYNVKTLRELPYLSALYRKNIWAKELSDELLEVHYMERDNKRLNDIKKAIDFNKVMIAEMFEGDKE